MFSSAIEDLHLPWNAWRQGHAVVVGDNDLPTTTLPGGMKVTLLSPTPAQLQKLAPAWQQELKKAGLVPGSHVDYSQLPQRLAVELHRRGPAGGHTVRRRRCAGPMDRALPCSPNSAAQVCSSAPTLTTRCSRKACAVCCASVASIV
jgi:hypothetical protein